MIELWHLFESMIRPWHALVLVVIFYLSWQSFISISPRQKEFKKAKFQYVNAGMFCTIGQVILMFLLHSNGAQLGVFLPFICFLTWTVTACLILAGSNLSTLARRICLCFIFAGPFIILHNYNNTHTFLNDIDSFAVALRGQGQDVQPRMDVTNAGTLRPTNETESDKPNDSRQQFKISHLLKAVFFFIHAFLVTSYYGRMWQLRYQYKLKEKSKKTLGSATLDQIIFVVSMALSVWLSFVLLGFDTLSVSIFSGLVALGVSVALRDLLSNFVAGILLFWDKSVRVGDVIAMDKSSYGEVTDITMRYLIVQDRNDIEYLVPHSKLINSTVENWTRDRRQVRLKLDIGVAYGSPIEKVKDIMQSVCFDVPRVLKKPPPNPLIMSMGDSSINFQLRFRISDPENGIRNVMSEVYERLVDRFKEAGIEIPYPQREIRLRTPARADEQSSVSISTK